MRALYDISRKSCKLCREIAFSDCVRERRMTRVGFKLPLRVGLNLAPLPAFERTEACALEAANHAGVAISSYLRGTRCEVQKIVTYNE